MTTIANTEEMVRRKAMELFPGSPVDQAYFLGLARQESGFNPAAYNAQGDAYGLFQFAGDMRRAYGMDTKSPVEVQLSAAGDYLKKLHEKYKGNWEKILAEHYMGLSRLRRAESGERDAEVRSFYASHLPKVAAHARRYIGVTPTKAATDITLSPPPPVSSVDSIARVAQRPIQAPLPVSAQSSSSTRVDLQALLGLLAALRPAPVTFGRVK